jgi:LysM repeat protein
MNQLKKIITLSVFLLPYLLGANALASFNQNRVFSNFPKQEKVSIDPSGSFINIKYRVRRNDNLWEISKRFEVDYKGLVQFNNLLEPDKIFPGDELIIRIGIGTSPYRVTINSKKIFKYNLSETSQDSFMEVIHPDKNNPLAPSVPFAYYSGPESFNFSSKITGPRKKIVSSSFSKVLQNINSILKLLDIDIELPISKKVTSSNCFFSGFNLLINPKSPHLSVDNFESSVFIKINLFKSLIPTKASHPPKYL